MRSFSTSDVVSATGGQLVSPRRDDGVVMSVVCTDTRDMKAACCFFALVGENFDAHAFLPKAAAAGAYTAVVSQVPQDSLGSLELVLVDDTRRALGDFAAHVRGEFTKTKVVGVAGSNGKTSTKHLVHSVLRTTRIGSLSPKSFNNDIGVPLTLFAAEPDDDYVVCELGTNHPGEIRRLGEISTPDVGVITNCGPEHLEFLKDLDGVRRENAELAGFVKEALVVNGDDPALLATLKLGGYAGRLVTFGESAHCDLVVADIVCGEAGTRFTLNGRGHFVPLLGRHTAFNAAAAAGVGRELGLADDTIAAALEQATGADMRLQMQTLGQVRVLNDAYNANPASMKAALETLAALPCTGRRIAVVGDMLELGETGPALHAEVGRHAATLPIDVLVGVGRLGRLIAEAAAGLPQTHTAETADAVTLETRPGDLVLLKGSRGMKLERVLERVRSTQAAEMGRAERE